MADIGLDVKVLLTRILSLEGQMCGMTWVAKGSSKMKYQLSSSIKFGKILAKSMIMD
jgi:hypothetical protein